MVVVGSDGGRRKGKEEGGRGKRREEGERGGRERGREKLCGSMRIVPWIILWKGVCCELICGVLFQDVLDWPTSRKFFYWRLRRRLCEQEALKFVMDADQ